MPHICKTADKRTHFIIGFLALLLSGCFADTARAQVKSILWSAPANVCVPADAPIKFNRYKVNLVSVQHALDNVDLITLNCPIGFFNWSPAATNSWQLGVTYRDSTGIGPTAFVRARLYRLAGGGTVPTLMAEINSNSFANTGATSQRSASFVHAFDFMANSYWVHVDLDRSSTSDVVILYNLNLVADTCGTC